ncbi:MAG: hypothetical protein ACJASL_003870 [Paraglaciecola sp.]|jgi:hypothetical protein
MNSKDLVGREIKTSNGSAKILSANFVKLLTNMNDLSIIKIVEIKTKGDVFKMDIKDAIKALKEGKQ